VPYTASALDGLTLVRLPVALSTPLNIACFIYQILVISLENGKELITRRLTAIGERALDFSFDWN
jgi:hypothetical protein